MDSLVRVKEQRAANEWREVAGPQARRSSQRDRVSAREIDWAGERAMPWYPSVVGTWALQGSSCIPCHFSYRDVGPRGCLVAWLRRWWLALGVTSCHQQSIICLLSRCRTSVTDDHCWTMTSPDDSCLPLRSDREIQEYFWQGVCSVEENDLTHDVSIKRVASLGAIVRVVLSPTRTRPRERSYHERPLSHCLVVHLPNSLMWM